MPTAPYKPCRGCGRALAGGGWCATCRPERYRQQDARRGTSSERGYNARWRIIRLGVLTAPPQAYVDAQGIIRGQGPLCVMCSLEGKTTPAKEVDHIDGNSRRNEPLNLRPLCRHHHSARTMSDQVRG